MLTECRGAHIFGTQVNLCSFFPDSIVTLKKKSGFHAYFVPFHLIVFSLVVEHTGEGGMKFIRSLFI